MYADTACATQPFAHAQGTTFTARQSGYLNVDLTGKGDWDLVVRDVHGDRVGASQSPGGHERVGTWIAKGQRIKAIACRQPSAHGTPKYAFTLTPGKPAEGTATLQPEAIAAATHQQSALPSGRTTYRTYEDYQAELKQLAADHPGEVRPVHFGTSYQGRSIDGIELADDVNARDGRPVFFLMGLHHAREWPSGEAVMEFAELLVKNPSNARIAALLKNERVVLLPIVNPDGFISSRTAKDPGDMLGGGDYGLSTVEAIAPPGGVLAYRRKNCDGGNPNASCDTAAGVDINRNYGNLWGGTGASPDPTSQSYHGAGPRSEPETQAVWNFVRTHQVTTLMTLHNVAALVLRPPGLSVQGKSPDDAGLKALGDAMGKAAGYTSQASYELYDTSGATEDDSYGATGGYGYTIEMGPPNGPFHGDYATSVIAEWTGQNTHGAAGGMQEALLLAAENAADVKNHAVLTGTAPAGRTLRLKRAFVTKTSSYCANGLDPAVNLGSPICPGGLQAPKELNDELDSTTIVPASGTFAWHVDQSTQPYVAAAGQKQAYTLTCEDGAGKVLDTTPVTVDRGETLYATVGCGKGKTTIATTPPKPTLKVTGVRLKASHQRGVRIRVACNGQLQTPCSGRVFLRAKLSRSKLTTVAQRTFTVKPGTKPILDLRLTTRSFAVLRRKGRISVTVSATAKAGSTTLKASRKLTLRRP